MEDETRKCEKVMTFKMNWIDVYWTEPMLVSLSSSNLRLAGRLYLIHRHSLQAKSVDASRSRLYINAIIRSRFFKHSNSSVSNLKIGPCGPELIWHC